MVYYFLCELFNPPLVIYMGEDKYANEELIRYGHPEDIWFHVSDFSSAHVYLRLAPGMSIEDIPPEVVEDCAQLSKANSIDGCKQSSVRVVYTPWSNLNKTGDMTEGQVGFIDKKKVLSTVVRKDTAILKRLDKTKKQQMKPDLAQARQDRDKEENQKAKIAHIKEKEQEKQRIKDLKMKEELKTYKSILVEENMESNKKNYASNYAEYEENFM